MFNFKNEISKDFYEKDAKIAKEYLKVIKNISFNIDFKKDTFHSLSNKFKFSFKIKDLQKFKRFKSIAIIGMGGSILGSEAIYNFLKKKIKKKFFFIDNIDEDELTKIKKEHQLDKVLFIIISKSGNTIETLSNILALNIIKKKSKNIIIISEKNNNPLYLLSKKMELFHIEHKNYIGGRYSVLSEVGIVPAYLMGINIMELRKNLFSYVLSKHKYSLKNSLQILSSLLKKGKLNTIIFLNYEPKLQKFLSWNQQLMAESLGKKTKGFLPFISSVPKDHHSLLQLYLDGPKDKLFYIFSSENDYKIKIKSKIMGKELDFLDKKKLSKIKKAQKNALIKIFKQKKIPFREFSIKNINEKTLGELFSYFILETAILGKISKINPFDQPAVDQVKIRTKQNLI